MKAKRLAALALTVLMMLSLLTLPAAAVSFTDMTDHWAKEDVEYLATQGIVNGTSSTTFSPDRKMTACEALLFCSRATGVSATDKAKIAEAWAEELKTLLPEEMYSWAAEEMAVCLETGILSKTELKAMADSGSLAKAITRETLSMYLVRAMQLEPLARGLSSYSMNFEDASSISQALQPYVYLLNMYGIVQGNQSNQFMPQGSLTRAEMATMLRRAIDFMDDRGIYAELPAYTTYDWVGGTIAAVSAGTNGVTLLTLESNLSGTRSVSLPATVAVYENNMLSSTSALKVGQYARVNLNSSGTAESVRLGGVLTTYNGTPTSVTADNITLSVEGSVKSLDIDRFTEVQVGKTVGGPELIDPQSGYTSAVCQVDSQGHLSTLQLSGGTRAAGGILTAVESTSGGQSLQVCAFNGETQRYTLPTGAGVTINGVAGTLTSSNVGDYVSLRVSNESTGQLASIAVDTVTQYVQGSVKSFTYSRTVNEITLSDLATGKSTTYDIDPNAVIRYNGQNIVLEKLEKNAFVTLQISSGKAVLVDSYPSSTTTEGVIDSITYGTPTILAVRTAGDSVVTFELDLTALPTIYRNGKASSIDQLRSGDQVVVTVRYNTVTTLETTPQSANVTGTITRVVQDTSGITIDVTLTDGTSASYSVADGVSVTQDGTAVSLYNLKPNDQVAMVVSGESVVSIEVTQGTSTGSQLTGTVLVANNNDKTLMLQLENGTVLTADVSGTQFIGADGSSVYLSKLVAGDRVQLFGSYSGAKFVATLVLKL